MKNPPPPPPHTHTQVERKRNVTDYDSYMIPQSHINRFVVVFLNYDKVPTLKSTIMNRVRAIFIFVSEVFYVCSDFTLPSLIGWLKNLAPLASSFGSTNRLFYSICAEPE